MQRLPRSRLLAATVVGILMLVVLSSLALCAPTRAGERAPIRDPHRIIYEHVWSYKELAQRLFISDHTLRNHLTSIYQKLGVSNRLELYVYAVKHQLANSTAISPAAQTSP